MFRKKRVIRGKPFPFCGQCRFKFVSELLLVPLKSVNKRNVPVPTRQKILRRVKELTFYLYCPPPFTRHRFLGTVNEPRPRPDVFQESLPRTINNKTNMDYTSSLVSSRPFPRRLSDSQTLYGPFPVSTSRLSLSSEVSRQVLVYRPSTVSVCILGPRRRHFGGTVYNVFLGTTLVPLGPRLDPVPHRPVLGSGRDSLLFSLPTTVYRSLTRPGARGGPFEEHLRRRPKVPPGTKFGFKRTADLRSPVPTQVSTSHSVTESL